MTYEVVERPDGGVTLNFDHIGFATVDGVRDWTIGWATKMLALKKYAVTGKPDPFFGSWRSGSPRARKRAVCR